MSWVDGDAVSLHVVDKSGVVLQENRKFIYNAETHTFEGEFTSHPEITDWEGDRYSACEWYAYYPYSPNHTSNAIFRNDSNRAIRRKSVDRGATIFSAKITIS